MLNSLLQEFVTHISGKQTDKRTNH